MLGPLDADRVGRAHQLRHFHVSSAPRSLDLAVIFGRNFYTSTVMVFILLVRSRRSWPDGRGRERESKSSCILCRTSYVLCVLYVRRRQQASHSVNRHYYDNLQLQYDFQIGRAAAEVPVELRSYGSYVQDLQVELQLGLSIS